MTTKCKHINHLKFGDTRWCRICGAHSDDYNIRENSNSERKWTLPLHLQDVKLDEEGFPE